MVFLINMIFRIIFFILISFQLLANGCKKPQMPSIEEWNSWLNNIKLEAIKEGISKETVYKELEGRLPQKKIIFYLDLIKNCFMILKVL